MPIVTNIQVISLGWNPDLDPNENRIGAENAGSLLGRTYGSEGNPLARNISQLTLHDGNSNGLVPFNGPLGSGNATEYVTFNGSNHYIDTGILYSGSITYMNGTTVHNVPLRVVQATDGNMALLPPPADASSSEINALTSLPLQSIRLTSVLQNNFTDLNSARYGLAGPPTFVCFRNGTMIMTDRGNVAVEDLKAGDMVLTRDNGLQQLRWIGSKQMGSELLQMFPQLRPVRIQAGALGDGLPERDLYVSQQHRILVNSKIALRMMGDSEVLIAAKFLTEIDGIDIDDSAEALEYFHLLFDQHEIVLSEGAATESLFTGAEALRSVDPAARAEMIALFPELTGADHEFAAVRRISTGREGRKLAQRHVANKRELQRADRS